MFSQTKRALEDFDNQHDFERMSADILNSLGYQAVEPMAPSGGADKGKDIAFREGDSPGVAFVTLDNKIRDKFKRDLGKQQSGEGVIALFCNVDVSPSMKLEFAKEAISKGYRIAIFDLERLRSLLDSALQALIYAQLRDSVGGTVRCFLSSDRFQLDAGEDWMARVKDELGRADVVVLMLSPQSLQRHWVNLEGGAAWVKDRLVIPVYYSGLTVGNIPRPYSDFNAIALDTEPYHLLRSIGKSILLTPPPLPHDHPAYERLEYELQRNTKRLAAWKVDGRKEQIREILYFAIAEVADRSRTPVRDIGFHVWSLQTVDYEEVLTRLVRSRLSHSPTSPLRNWRRGEGAVGVCWATERDIVLDLADPHYSVDSEAEWQKLPPELRVGMSLADFRKMTAPFKAIFAVPIKLEETLIGCLSANFDRDVEFAPAEIWSSAKEVMRRVAADLGRILQTGGRAA